MKEPVRFKTKWEELQVSYLKRFIHILLISYSCLTFATLQGLGQDLPSACVGTVERYWVKGFNGHSTFTWTITDEDGNFVPYTVIDQAGRGDSIQISWNSTISPGICTFSVVETSEYGCTGDPWDEQYVIFNTQEIFIPVNSLPGQIAVCFGDTAELDPGSGYLDYLWHNGSTNQIFYTDTAGTFQVRLVDTEQNCSYDTTNVIINPLPIVDLGNDTVLMGNQTITLDAYDPSFDFYSWIRYNYSNNEWESTPFAISESVIASGTDGKQWISVLVTDNNGCENSDSIKIEAGDYNNLKIPAAFTPNGDGKNDTWILPYLEDEDGNKVDVSAYLTDVSIRVFNRYGKLVWEHSGNVKHWDGKDLNGRELPMDSYHYIIRINVGKKTYMQKGSVTIVR